MGKDLKTKVLNHKLKDNLSEQGSQEKTYKTAQDEYQKPINILNITPLNMCYLNSLSRLNKDK
jgi:hypothetical protein